MYLLNHSTSAKCGLSFLNITEPITNNTNITIQKYLTPNGTDIHKKGITPDVLVELSENDIKTKNDVQLKKAIEVAQQLSSGTYVVKK